MNEKEIYRNLFFETLEALKNLRDRLSESQPAIALEIEAKLVTLRQELEALLKEAEVEGALPEALEPKPVPGPKLAEPSFLEELQFRLRDFVEDFLVPNWIMVLLVLTMLGAVAFCSLFELRYRVIFPRPTPTATPTSTPTPTPVPTLAPTATLVPIPLGMVTCEVLNLRAGPSTQHEVLGGLVYGAQLEVLARDESMTWLRVRSAEGEGWVASFCVTLDFPIENLELYRGE